MSFIKKNYEKVLLGAVLLGLVGSLLFLPVIIAHDQQNLADTRDHLIKTPPKPLAALDMSGESNILNRVEAPYTLDFETTNRLFNPVQWQRRTDGSLIKIETGKEVGPNAVKVANIKPLYYILRLDSIEPATQVSAARYVISIQHENAASPIQRRPHQHFVSVGEKEEALSLISASGPADNPQLVLQILDSGQTVTLTKSQPFERVEGYAADMTYPPEGKKWADQRVGAALKFYGNDYNVVVIDQNEVVISAQSNQKKYTLPYQP
jgi:hypothetical protein